MQRSNLKLKLVGKVSAAYWSRVEQRSKDECWPWRGRVSSAGYGALYFEGGTWRATHIALELSGHEKPSDNHFALHRCDNPGCVNPDHLWWGTPKENSQDMASKGRHGAQKKTHCVSGHPLSGVNLGRKLTGERFCRACQRVGNAASYKKRMEKLRCAQI